MWIKAAFNKGSEITSIRQDKYQTGERIVHVRVQQNWYSYVPIMYVVFIEFPEIWNSIELIKRVAVLINHNLF